MDFRQEFCVGATSCYGGGEWGKSERIRAVGCKGVSVEPESVYMDSLDADVILAPCPSWCTVEEHFPDRCPETTDEDFRHYGPNVEVKPDQPGSGECTASDVAVAVWARSKNLLAEAGPAWVELNLCSGSADKPDLWIDLTPARAREVGMMLVDFAELAEAGAQQKP